MDPLQTPPQAPQMPPTMPVNEPKKSSLGPIIGIIVIVILLILGALYVWKDRMPSEEPVANTNAPATASVTSQEPADDISTIESELEANGEVEIDLSGLDTI